MKRRPGVRGPARVTVRPFDARSLLLLWATIATLIAVAVTMLWIRDLRRQVEIDELSDSDRQELVAELIRRSPGAFEPAWYHPPIGYTLKPGEELSIWGARFTSNDLGYRAGEAAKRGDTFRILWVGDSWAYGQGITRREAFPHVVEELANRHAGLGRSVESWTLALPGYSAVNQTAALWFFFLQLDPDAVVFVPSSNDHHSGPGVLPSGSLVAGGIRAADPFGDPHPVVYRFPLAVDSFRCLERWRRSFGLWRVSVERLRGLGIPAALLFVARWQADVVHRFMAESEIDAPYAVVPARLTLGRWVNADPGRHGTPAANRLYGQLGYRLLASRLGWQELPQEALETEVAGLPIFSAPPEPAEWGRAAARILRDLSRRHVAARFRRQPEFASQWVGPGSSASGAFGGSITVLVRPRPGTGCLTVAVRRLPEAAALYPLGLEIAIPAPSGGTRSELVIPAAGDPLRELEVEVPPELRRGQVLDVVLSADRQTAFRPRRGGSLIVERIDPGCADRRRSGR